MRLLKSLLIGCSLVIGAVVCTLAPVAAGGGPIVPILRVIPSTPSATVGSSVNFTINSYYIKCISNSNPNDYYYSGEGDGLCSTGYSQQGEMPAAGDYSIADPITIAASGNGNTISPSSLTIDSNTGNAQFTLNSSVAESKTVTVTQHYAGYVPDFQSATTTVTFTPAPAAPIPAAPVTTPKIPTAVAPKKTTPAPAAPTTPTPTTPTVVTPPTAPTPTITLGGTTIASTTTPTVKDSMPLVLSGTTVSNGVVTIFVHSVLHKYTVTADKTGAWSYTVPTTDLPAGTHHIDATVTDPATGKTSAQTRVLAFTLTKATLPISGTITKKPITKHNSTLAVIGVAVVSLLVLLALVAAYMWKFQRALFDNMLRRLHLSKKTLEDDKKDDNSSVNHTPSSPIVPTTPTSMQPRF